MVNMMWRKRESTSCLVHDKRIEFWLISSPEVATPPAFAAFPGPYRILPLRNTVIASGVDGIFAPSETTKHPFFSNNAASAPEISFCVADGRATWQGTSHGVDFPSTYVHLYLSAYSLILPLFTFLRFITNASFSSLKPSASSISPLESDIVTTFAPIWIAFCVAYCATLPEPDTVQILSFRLSPL